MNPIEMMQMMLHGGNPQAIVKQMLSNKQVAENPIVKNAMQMLNNGDTEGLMELAENMARERGTTIDEVKNKLGY